MLKGGQLVTVGETTMIANGSRKREGKRDRGGRNDRDTRWLASRLSSSFDREGDGSNGNDSGNFIREIARSPTRNSRAIVNPGRFAEGQSNSSQVASLSLAFLCSDTAMVFRYHRRFPSRASSYYVITVIYSRKGISRR